MTNHDIDRLMKRIALGDMAALEELYKNMSKPVYFYALRLTGSPEAAEDVMQDTFISVLKGSGNYKEKGEPCQESTLRLLSAQTTRYGIFV